MRILTPVLLAGAALLCVGTSAQAQRQLTEAETQTAYRAVVRYVFTDILGDYESHLGFPTVDLRNVHFGPIEQTTFTPGARGSIIVQIDVDYNNPVGVLLKHRFRFRVWGAPRDPMVAISYGVAMRETK